MELKGFFLHPNFFQEFNSKMGHWKINKILLFSLTFTIKQNEEVQLVII